MTARQHAPGWSEEYRGYVIAQGEPQYGKQFAYRFGLIDSDDGKQWFEATPEECKRAIDEECEFPRGLRL